MWYSDVLFFLCYLCHMSFNLSIDGFLFSNHSFVFVSVVYPALLVYLFLSSWQLSCPTVLLKTDSMDLPNDMICMYV